MNNSINQSKTMNSAMVKLAAGALALTAGMASSAMADMVYNFSYSGSLSNASIYATGYVNITGKAAVSGSITVSGTGSMDGVYALVPGEGSTASFIWDSVFDIASGTYLTSTGGLQFMNNAGDEINMWANGGDSYSLYGHLHTDAAWAYSPADVGGHFGANPAPTPGVLALVGVAGALSGRRRRN